MSIFKKKKKKKQATHGKFESLEVDGKVLPVLNFYLFKNSEDGFRYIELTALEAIPELHFSEVTMNVVLTEKKLTFNTEFKDAFAKGKFKVYKFKVNSVKEYFI